MRTRVYDAWRESEAYAVPMTEEGEKAAELRWYSFKKGYEAALREAACILEQEHAKVKRSTSEHNFYLVSSRIVKRMIYEET